MRCNFTWKVVVGVLFCVPLQAAGTQFGLALAILPRSFWRDQSQIFPFFPKHTLGGGERFLFYTDFKSKGRWERSGREPLFLAAGECPAPDQAGSGLPEAAQPHYVISVRWTPWRHTPSHTESAQLCSLGLFIPALSLKRKVLTTPTCSKLVLGLGWRDVHLDSVKEGSERGWMLPLRVSRRTESQVGRKGEGGGSEKQDR